MTPRTVLTSVENKFDFRLQTEDNLHKEALSPLGGIEFRLTEQVHIDNEQNFIVPYKQMKGNKNLLLI